MLEWDAVNAKGQQWAAEIRSEAEHMPVELFTVGRGKPNKMENPLVHFGDGTPCLAIQLYHSGSANDMMGIETFIEVKGACSLVACCVVLSSISLDTLGASKFGGLPGTSSQAPSLVQRFTRHTKTFLRDCPGLGSSTGSTRLRQSGCGSSRRYGFCTENAYIYLYPLDQLRRDDAIRPIFFFPQEGYAVLLPKQGTLLGRGH